MRVGFSDLSSETIPSLYLVADQQLHGVAAPLHEHQLVGLAGHGVGEGRAEAGAGAGLQPQADAHAAINSLFTEDEAN
ncbi:hypothetical protein EYF80_015952 [Liparis tanakae]|uniref:Uncharacterized protein n=1 Tax=Liparis tanakae TaxID=230148 RepID=A0A4Z2I950_9TELE|nr:hypothetical protein EYF80_015952 [Liparis tanakae]